MLLMGKLRLRKVKELDQDHRITKQRGKNSVKPNPAYMLKLKDFLVVSQLCSTNFGGGKRNLNSSLCKEAKKTPNNINNS